MAIRMLRLASSGSLGSVSFDRSRAQCRSSDRRLAIAAWHGAMRVCIMCIGRQEVGPEGAWLRTSAAGANSRAVIPQRTHPHEQAAQTRSNHDVHITMRETAPESAAALALP